MSINEIVEKVKSKLSRFYMLFLVLVIASIFFALGRLSVLEDRKTPIQITNASLQALGSALPDSQAESLQAGEVANVISSVSNNNSGQARLPSPEGEANGGQVIGSKNGKKYYFPWCGTVKMIKPENQIKFASIDEARKAGFVPGGNCKGLK